MKRLLFFITIILSSLTSKAQHINDGIPQDSTAFSFETNDSLYHYSPSDTDVIDTSNTHLWQIGKTHKPFFSTGGFDTTFSIMTDTTHPYPTNANDWFVIKTHLRSNMIVDFWHKYQTKPHRDGGIVEFSVDTGNTWQNVLGSCNTDSTGMPGILTYNFYSKTDTLLGGVDWAFSGTSPGTSWLYSRIQFFWGLPVRLTGGPGCDFGTTRWGKPLYLRFRFVSDSVTVPFDGWIIDNIKIEGDLYVDVPSLTKTYNSLDIAPNPSQDGIFIFPALANEKNIDIEITNPVGQLVLKAPYTHKIDLSGYPKGLYLYRVRSSTEYYSGRLITE